MAQPITPPSTLPPQNIQTDEASSSEGPRGFRGLRELYDVTEENDGITPAKARCRTFKKRLDDEQFTWFLFVCWTLWNFRNSKLVDETQTKPVVLMQNAQQHFNALKNAILDQKQTGTPTMVTSWRKPSSSRIKLSFDGAVSTIRNGIGVGVVARNIEGECVDWLASFFTRSTDALHAEALVARSAADLAQRRGWNHADLEGNS
ncbi:hypothetical protein Salat_1145300 [Sesamum alatum]|uniref:RNase H type-1 domain-containing protein n=1 Tax=Sesamum alatum TaxID=300844 RepID=A0AAE1YEB3_9LAMI|nr:hypothetical protein Salat_1145300 [Sesamum alatum]